MSARPCKAYFSEEVPPGLDGGRSTSVAEPGRRILLIENDRGAEKIERASGITTREGRKAVALELSRRALGKAACFLAQQCGKPHDPGCEIVLNESFLGEDRSGEKQGNGQSRKTRPRAHSSPLHVRTFARRHR